MKSSWSDLPIDILLQVQERLELPQILASAVVCTSRYSAATTTGILPCRVPWFVFLAAEGEVRHRHYWRRGDSGTNEFRSPLNPDKSYLVSFPWGYFQHCCGASHGWLIASDEISNLVLYNPFSLAVIPLPPVVDFASTKAVRGSNGTIKSYHFNGGDYGVDATHLGSWFYQKAVLSCVPSQGSNRCISMIIHHDCNWLSYAKVGDRRWHVASVINRNGDYYADYIYHAGEFYHVRLLLAHRQEKYPRNVKVKIGRVDLEKGGMEELKLETALREHAVFLGQNHYSYLPTNKFHELRPNCIYLTTPMMTQEEFFYNRRHGLRGVRIYDLANATLEDAFPNCAYNCEGISSSDLIWITPNYCNDRLE